MKRIKYLIFGVIFIFSFVVEVNAASYTEGEWKSPTCGDYASKISTAYTAYTFNNTTGKFATSGTTYSASTDHPIKTYEVKDDGATLVIYVIDYDTNVNGMASIKALPAPSAKCGTSIYSATKTATSTSGTVTEGDKNNTSSSSKADDGIVVEDNEESADDEESESSNTWGDTVRTTENPNTGIPTGILFVIPAALLAGIILVFKRQDIFSFKN